MKYQTPKILLLDMDIAVSERLTKLGFNVSIGSLGRPYRVTPSTDQLPVVANGSLPTNYQEQDIVVVDFAINGFSERPWKTSSSEIIGNRVTASAVKGLIDPRGVFARQQRSAFLRIVEHGGVLVVFAAGETRQAVQIQQERSVGTFTTPRVESFYDLWELVRLTEDKFHWTQNAFGEDMQLAGVAATPLDMLIRKHLATSTYGTTFSAFSSKPLPFTKLATNKFGDIVSALRGPNPMGGMILILPQIGAKGEFLEQLFTEVLCDVTPQLFPSAERAGWLQSSEYEFPQVQQLQVKIEDVRREAELRIVELESQIVVEREKNAYLADLLTATDQVLVDGVKQALAELGFEQVVDVDEQRGLIQSGPRREDLQIHDYTPVLLLEIKGINGLPSEADSLQGWKYVAPRMRELQRLDVQALSLINHQRQLPPLDRNNVNPFSADVVINASEHHFGLLTAWDLYRLIRSFRRNSWTHQVVKDVLYRTGRIMPVPSHFEPLGVIEAYWEKASAIGMRLTRGDLQPGDRIAFELPVEFVEQEVDSMQIDGSLVTHAASDSRVGIRTNLSKSEARKGVRIYKVGQSGTLGEHR